MSEKDVIVAPTIRDLDKLSADLGAWMRLRMPDASGLRLGNFAYPYGAGRSHETILFDAAWTENGRAREQGMVVRVKPTQHQYYPDDLFEQQYRLMRVLRDQARVKVANVFWYEADPDLLGAPFFVMEKLKGRVAVSTPPYAQVGWVAEAAPADRAKLWENGVRQLAIIQQTPVSSLGFLSDPAKGGSGLTQEWDKYVRFVAWMGQSHSCEILERALEELERRWPKNQPEGLVWGDARLGNILFDDNLEVVAVMDWEQPSLGGALHDLAWWTYIDELNHGASFGRKALQGMGSRDEAIALWRAVCGKSSDEFEWYEDFVSVKIAVLAIRTAELREQPPHDEAGLRRLLTLLRPWIE